MIVSHDYRKETTNILGSCRVTGEEYSATVPTTGFIAWQQGAMIQEALPNISDNVREFLISGTSPKGWNRLHARDIVMDQIDEEIDNLDAEYAASDVPWLLSTGLTELCVAILIRELIQEKENES